MMKQKLSSALIVLIFVIVAAMPALAMQQNTAETGTPFMHTFITNVRSGNGKGPGGGSGGPAPSGPTSYPAYTPGQIFHAYNYSATYNGAGETIAIIDAYGSPSIQNDVKVFDTQFNLPAIKLTVLTPFGKVGRNSGWALETSLDVEWSHAMAPSASILLIEAPSASTTYLITDSINYIVNHTNANVVSMSWGAAESGLTASELSQYSATFAYAASHGVILVAASGDSGANDGTTSPTVNYPASDPSVVGAGGTTLLLTGITATSATYSSEYAWNSSGGGISNYFPEPSYQSAAHINASGRAVPDVSYDANPNTGFWIYDSTSYEGLKGWIQVGGTSASSPQWAAIFTEVQQYKSSKTFNGTNVLSSLYTVYSISAEYASAFHDITVGYNGAYSAGAGYDEVTGIGSPNVGALIEYL
ncbi:MAG: S53 family peptidase [Methanomassiliicoccales archaeon]|nr:S53 family peptidase [Methanomassiliicoccales archaeon]